MALENATVELDHSEHVRKVISLKRSRAGHLSEISKIYKQLDSFLLDYEFFRKVQILDEKLKRQWMKYSSINDQLQLLIPEDSEKDYVMQHSNNYRHYVTMIKEYICEAEKYFKELRESDLIDFGLPVTPVVSSIYSEDEESLPRTALPEALLRGYDWRSTISTRTKQFSVLSQRPQEGARIERILAEKKLVQLKRAKQRKLKEQELKLENEIAEAQDFMELATTKDQLYEELGLGDHDWQTLNPIEVKYENDNTVVNSPITNQEDLTLNTEPKQIISSTPKQTIRLQTDDHVFSKIVTSMDAILTKTSLPTLEVVKFTGNPCEYFKFKSRFNEMVLSQNLTEAQKMNRLLQFLDGKARKAVVGFEGMPGGLTKALGILEQRFGQPHIVAKACIDVLIEGPNISSSDKQGLQEFADKARTLYETLSTMNALSEMNMTNLGKMSARLPIGLQIKWRDEVQRIRQRGELPTFEKLVQFVQHRANAINDPIFGSIGETKKLKGSITKKGNRGNKVIAMSTVIEGKSYSEQQVSSQSSNLSDSTQQRPNKCSCCGLMHKLENCEDFKSKSLRQRGTFVRSKGLCINCFKKGHFAAQCYAKTRCNVCHQRHNSLLHKEVTMRNTGSSDVQTAPSIDTGAAVVQNINIKVDESPGVFRSGGLYPKIALQVVPVKVMSNDGNAITTYALLDTGSEASFVTKSLIDRLKLDIKSYEELAVCTLSGEQDVRVGIVDLIVKSADDSRGRTVAVQDVKVVEKLNINLTRPKNLLKWPHLIGIEIPEVEDKEVTMLIGANVPECQVHEESRVGKAGEPYAVRTILGWAILGPVGTGQSRSKKTNVNFYRYGDDILDQQVKQFFEYDTFEKVESIGKVMSVEDLKALNIMENTVCKRGGHYQVGMLWRSENPWLPNNIEMAKARLRSLHRKLLRDKDLHKKYSDFMKNLFTKGYARKLKNEDVERHTRKTWYLFSSRSFSSAKT